MDASSRGLSEGYKNFLKSFINCFKEEGVYLKAPNGKFILSNDNHRSFLLKQYKRRRLKTRVKFEDLAEYRKKKGEEREALLIEIMKGDEELGLYDSQR